MACPNRNRHRPRTVAFRLTDDEFVRIEQRVKVTGEVKGDFLREVVLNGEVHISIGKFKSDKLALALKNLINELEMIMQRGIERELENKINESYIMVQEMYKLMIIEESELTV